MAVLNQLRTRILFLTGIGLFGALLLAAQPQSLDYKLKAVYVFNFLKFTRWPPDAFSNSEAPIIIGIVGKDPFGSAMDEAVRDERILGRPVVVKRFPRLEDISVCHALYVSKSEKQRAAAILSKLGTASVLTISDLEDFAREGGIIELYYKDGQLRFKISTSSANKANLKLASQLLKLAKISER